MSTNSKSPIPNKVSTSTLRWVALDQITEPGAYVTREGGHLIRIPRDGGSQGDQELLNPPADQTVDVTKISSNPFIPISQARFATAGLDIEVNF